MNSTMEDIQISGETGAIVMTETISLLTILSLTAICTTISLFFCGLPICIEIYRRKSTDEISPFPFLMGLLGGAFWLRYGFLRADLTMISVNVVGVTLMFLYLVFYTYYSESRSGILAKICIVFAIIGAMLILVEIYSVQIIDPLGFTCMLFNILNFGAPLAGVTVVFKKRCCDTLPLPLCTANLLVSAQWCLYGMLVNDPYIIVPNAAGVGLAVLQISLFLVFPRQSGTRAPLSLCFVCLDTLEMNEKPSSVDLEKVIAQEIWLKRNTVFQSSLPPLSRVPKPRKNCLTLIRTANVFPSDPFNSSETAITIFPNWSLTSSASHPDLVQQQIEEEEASVLQTKIFDRIQEIDELDRQWTDNKLKRTMSAPEMAESGVDSLRQASDELI